MHQTAYADAAAFVGKYIKPPRKVIDIGSMNVNGCLRPLFRGCDYTGADIAKGENVDVVLPAPYHWPNLEDNTFDVAVSSQVLEHVPAPWRWLPELVRIVKPGGLVYLCSPNTMPFHAYPVDCWRVWPDGLRALMEDAGLEVIECRSAGRDTTGIGRKRS